MNLLLHFLRNTPNNCKSSGPSSSVKVRIHSVLQVSENFDTQDEATYLEKLSPTREINLLASK